MILYEFIKKYGYPGGGNDLISIEGYCEEYSQEDVTSAEWFDKIKYRPIAEGVESKHYNSFKELLHEIENEKDQ